MDTPLHWIAFIACVLITIALDLGVFHRKAHKISLRESAAWSVVWITLAMAFGLWILHGYGRQPALEFFTGYVIEKSLSVDNLFVFLVIFRVFAVKEEYQHSVLAYGIVAALLMRGVMIAAGAALVERFEWIMYLFGAFIIYAGLHMLVARQTESHPENNFLFRYVSKHIRVTRDYREGRFFVRENGKRYATPLLLVLLVVEITDVTFAVDSIPAIFGITRDPFIVFTSNVFAILGLRALYFLLAGVLDKFAYLKIALALVLAFIGGKMIAEPWLHIPVGVSLAVVLGMLASAVILSLLVKPKKVAGKDQPRSGKSGSGRMSEIKPEWIAGLASRDLEERAKAATEIYREGSRRAGLAVREWWKNAELARLCGPNPAATVGVAVQPTTFARIREANGWPRLAEVPSEQDASEFELHFPGSVALDVLTTREAGGSGAIARFLTRTGEGVQQVEFPCGDVDLAAAVLRRDFGVEAVYPAKRPGAGGTRVNFFLVGRTGEPKVLVELFEPGG